MAEYVQAASMRTGAPIHIVREYGESMVTITECGLRLAHPEFVQGSWDPYLCLNCQRKVEE